MNHSNQGLTCCVMYYFLATKTRRHKGADYTHIDLTVNLLLPACLRCNSHFVPLGLVAKKLTSDATTPDGSYLAPDSRDSC